MKKPVILYHENCPDGFGAAYAAWKKFGNKAEYFPIGPSQDQKQLSGIVLKGRYIYFLDVCVSLPTLLKLRMMNERVTVIDHHATNSSHIKHATEHVFDLNHSGAALAWQYFHPKKQVPMLLRYVEDSDLWRDKLPYTRPLCSYIHSHRFDFKTWDILAKNMESARERKRYLVLGKALEAYERVLVSEALERAELVQFGKYKALAVNSSSKRFHSEIGNALWRKRPPLGIVWRVERGAVNVSLRGDGSVDVSKVAKQFPGGGGHPNAAGFTVPLEKGFPWKWLEK